MENPVSHWDKPDKYPSVLYLFNVAALLSLRAPSQRHSLVILSRPFAV